jgi:hypothetical protein
MGSMPIDGFRRPELRNADKVQRFSRDMPTKYLRMLPYQNEYDAFMACVLVGDTARGTLYKTSQQLLRRYPFEFQFALLSPEQRTIWRKVAKKFTISELRLYFHPMNEHLDGSSGNLRLISGIKRLNHLIENQDQINSVLNNLNEEISKIRKSREEFAKSVVERVKHGADNLEKIAYLYGAPTKLELAILFFETPSFFAKTGACNKCDRELTNWISLVKGQGPVCGQHKYEIDIIGSSVKEISNYIIGLIEKKFPTQKNGPVSEQSPLLEFRKRNYHLINAGPRLYVEMHPFSDINIKRFLSINESDGDRWMDYVISRVAENFA